MAAARVELAQHIIRHMVVFPVARLRWGSVAVAASRLNCGSAVRSAGQTTEIAI
jgi:hypothetical protein